MRVTAFVSIMLVAWCALAGAQVPTHYPKSYSKVVDAARKDGELLIYSTTDLSTVAPLIRDFEAMYPGVKVDYRELNSPDLYKRFIAETSSGTRSADVLWSSAMDLQIKLANDNYAAEYRSPEIPFLPAWAVWRDEAFGTTFEPAVFVYNKRLLASDEVPQTHVDFARVLTTKPDRFKGNVTTYDIEKSAIGFLFSTQDSRSPQTFWTLVRAMGANAVELEANTSAMIERIASGKYLIGYNLIGSYAMARAKRDPAIGVVLPKDYTLVMSRIMLISKSARNVDAAKLWVDYVLSRRGQTLIATKSELFSIRDDVEGEFTSATLRKTLGASLKAIGVGPALLVYLDQSKRLEFIKLWRQATGSAP